MIKVTLTNEILKHITEIEKNRFQVSSEYSGVVEHLRRFKLNSVVGVN